MVRARDHTIDRRGDEAFLSLPGAVVCLMRHLLVARVRQRVLEQETALFCSGRMSFGGGVKWGDGWGWARSLGVSF